MRITVVCGDLVGVLVTWSKKEVTFTGASCVWLVDVLCALFLVVACFGVGIGLCGGLVF